MANTGFEISKNVAQFFTTGPNSGSKVTGSYDINLTDGTINWPKDENEK